MSIAVNTGYNRKNKLLLSLLTIWGLTGMKSVVFAAYEEIVSEKSIPMNKFAIHNINFAKYAALLVYDSDNTITIK